MTSPNPIENYLGDDVPIVVSNESLLVLQRPSIYEVPINPSLPESVTRACILQNCMVYVNISSHVVTKCSSLLCDRQNTLENLKTSKPCGCYGMSDLFSNLVYQHKINVFRKGNKLFTMKKFTSFKFDNMFLNERLIKSVIISDLEGVDVGGPVGEVIGAVIEYINNNGGFTVYGWYKRGEKDDTSSNDDTKRVQVNMFITLLICIILNHLFKIVTLLKV